MNDVHAAIRKMITEGAPLLPLGKTNPRVMQVSRSDKAERKRQKSENGSHVVMRMATPTISHRRDPQAPAHQARSEPLRSHAALSHESML